MVGILYSRLAQVFKGAPGRRQEPEILNHLELVVDAVSMEEAVQLQQVAEA